MDTQPDDWQLWEDDIAAAPGEHLPGRAYGVPYTCMSCLSVITIGWEHADGCDA